jgi:hypothetical protein
LEIWEKYLSLAVSVKEGSVSSMQEFWEFTEVLGFHEYGVILKAAKTENNRTYIYKDVKINSCLKTTLLYFF